VAEPVKRYGWRAADPGYGGRGIDLDMKARGHMLELLTTQLISEYLRTVADPGAQTKWARQHLHLPRG
jgi:hypothetical protein